MKINPINSAKKNISNTSFVKFQGRSRYLIPLEPSSFKKESSKKLYSKIKQYLTLIGECGNVEDVKIMRDKWREGNYTSGKKGFYAKEADIYLSIAKQEKNTSITLSREIPEKSRKLTILEALFNNNGQMIRGNFQIEDKIKFERNEKKNIRRMNTSEGKYFPVLSNDREWELLGRKLCFISDMHGFNPIKQDNSAGGAFELFIEFARLRTSIFK